MQEPTVEDLIENVPGMRELHERLTEDIKNALVEIYTRLETRDLQGLIDYFEPAMTEVPGEDGEPVVSVILKFNQEAFDKDLSCFLDF